VSFQTLANGDSLWQCSDSFRRSSRGSTHYADVDNGRLTVYGDHYHPSVVMTMLKSTEISLRPPFLSLNSVIFPQFVQVRSPWWCCTIVHAAAPPSQSDWLVLVIHFTCPQFRQGLRDQSIDFRVAIRSSCRRLVRCSMIKDYVDTTCVCPVVQMIEVRRVRLKSQEVHDLL
jgi:hypothetical protein